MMLLIIFVVGVVEIRVVGLYPKSVLRFISRQHLWLDRVARREWCDEGED